MSSVARPPETCLVAIILIVRSRAGPRFVFHYPPNPLSEKALGTHARRRKSDESGSSEESESSSDEDDELGNVAGGAIGARQNNAGEDNLSATTSGGGESQKAPSLGSGRTKKRAANSDAEDSPGLSATGRSNGPAHFRPQWDSVFGLPSDVWEKLLSPTRTWHKRRFEVGINDLAFVGWPVFVRDDGTWRKQKRRKKKKPRPEWEGGELGHEERLGDNQGEDAETVQDHEDEENATDRLGTAGGGKSNKEHETRGSRKPIDSPDADKDTMTMFNVVFVLDPPVLDYSMQLREMYENVIKKFGKALKWEQARADYVWKEAQNILQVKDKAREEKASVHSLYAKLIAHSSLARAIYTVFTSISTSKIASVTLSQDVSISLQISPLTSISYLPSPTDTAYPGLWLTTADSLSPADDAAASELDLHNQVLAKHFALLLLDNEASILKDVEASGGALGPALAHYIRCSKPNKSFAQISAFSGISLANIQLLASHLIYWRRARAIPPLHQRDTYIVSPNCDLSKLSVATAAYAAAFPTLPSLPKMLSALSGTPRPYASFIPSKDHKETYFTILAWLLRGGWVTELRSFARIKVTPEIKVAVERALRQEQISSAIGRMTPSEHEVDDNDSDDGDDHGGSPSSSSLVSQESDQLTAIPGRQDSDDQFGLSGSFMDWNHLNMSSLILFPHRASPLESRWLDEIMSRFPDRPGSDETSKLENSVGVGNDTEDPGLHDSLQKHWPKLVKYFNGHDALEKIAVREGSKRKAVWQILMRMGLGHALGVEVDHREQVLVSVRHW